VPVNLPTAIEAMRQPRRSLRTTAAGTSDPNIEGCGVRVVELIMAAARRSDEPRKRTTQYQP
jgi:hypothetical protein